MNQSNLISWSDSKTIDYPSDKKTVKSLLAFLTQASIVSFPLCSSDLILFQRGRDLDVIELHLKFLQLIELLLQELVLGLELVIAVNARRVQRSSDAVVVVLDRITTARTVDSAPADSIVHSS